MSKQLVSIVIPAFNESSGIGAVCNDIIAAIPKEYDYEIIIVDDGSSDQTVKTAQNLHTANSKIKLLALSRNFGKEIATSAGLAASKGDAVIAIDADGQHPAELIPKFLDKWQEGKQIVVGVRKSNSKEGFVKKYGSKLFYILLNKIAGVNMVPSSTDFRLIDREVCDAFVSLQESNRITRGLIDWLGFEPAYIAFHAKARQHGEASYSTRKLIKLALNSVVSLSLAPLYVSGYLGLFITLLSFIAGITIIIQDFLLGDPLHWNITGSASLGILILFLVGIVLVCQGFMALYVSRIYEETRKRPLYVVNRKKSTL